MAEPLLNTGEVAALLRVHPKHVYRLLKRGLPARWVGGEWRYARAEVLAWSGGGELRADDGERIALAPSGAPPSLVAANGDLAVWTLLHFAAESGPPLIGFVQADMQGGIALLQRGAVLAAGAHAGAFPSHVGPQRVARIHLVKREVGLLSRGPRPPRLGDLGRARLASRPPTAGVRGLLDDALRTARLDPRRIHGRALVLDSHLEVVMAVVAGRAEVGLASRAWASRAGLAFTPLAEESYGLLVRARDLGDARVVRLCEVAQGKSYRAAVEAHPGYDASGAGDIRYDS